jgi:hypothetical protein
MKKTRLLLPLFFAIALAFGVSFFSTQAQAQINNSLESLSLVAMPPRSGDEGQLRVAPGETIQTTIRVRNVSNRTISLRSYAQDFIVKEDGITPIPVRETVTNRWSLANWMAVTPNQHTLAPEESAEMAVTIEIPEDAMPGGRYAMVLHEPISESDITDTESSGAGVTQRIGTLFYVIVDGPINEEAYIRDFKFKKFQEFGPVPYSFLVRNQSDIHIRPRMSIDIFNMLGQKSDSIEVDSANIFPLNSRSFAGKWDKIWGFGLYTAKLTASYGDAGQVIVDSTNFWIVPVRIIISILFGGLLIALLVMAIKRNSDRRLELEQEKVKELQRQLDGTEEKPEKKTSKEKSK